MTIVVVKELNIVDGFFLSVLKSQWNLNVMNQNMTPKAETSFQTSSSATGIQTLQNKILDVPAVPGRGKHKKSNSSNKSLASKSSRRSRLSRRSLFRNASNVSNRQTYSETSIGIAASNKQHTSHKRPLLLRLNRKIRVKIWNLLDFSDRLSLRLTCKTIKTDIDEFVGLKAELDVGDESFPTLARLGLQEVTILDVYTVQGELLRFPLLVTEIQLLGVIRSFAFARLMRDCENIRSLTIEFGKESFIIKPKLFPVELKDSSKPILLKLRSLKFHGVAKNEIELKYVADNFIGLVNRHLLNRVHLSRLSVKIQSRFSHQLIDDCSTSMSTLVSESHNHLVDLHIEIRFQYALTTVADLGGDKTIPRNSLATSEDSPEQQQSTLALIFYQDVCVDKNEPSWQIFTKLKRLYFSTNARQFSCYWEKFGQNVKGLEIVFLDIPSVKSWVIYQGFISGSESTVEAVTLEGVENYGEENEKPKDINLSIFHQCKNLEALVLNQSKHPTMSNSRLKNVSNLPRTLKYLEFSWLYLTPCQILRLVKLPALYSLRLSYWSESDVDFGQLLCFLRLAFCCGGLQKDLEFIITDLKIRFQHNKRQLNRILRHKNINAEYIDFNNTQLILTRK